MPLIALQDAWHPADDPTRLITVIGAIRNPMTEPAVVLLPLADDGHEAVSEATFEEFLTEIAQATETAVAGAARVRAGKERFLTRALLVNAEGERLAAVTKVLPDLLDGFSDTASHLTEPLDTVIGDTPLGRMGLLIGEDVLSPQLVRATALKGAEIILNPAREQRDRRFDTRQAARAARAYENLVYLAVASPSHRGQGNGRIVLPAASAVYGWMASGPAASGNETAVIGDIDIEGLRRKRQEPHANFLAVLRTSLYGQGYAEPSNTPSPATRADWGKEADKRVAAIPAPPAPGSERIDQYDVVLAQTYLRNVPTVARKDEIIQANMDHSLKIAGHFASSPKVKLVLFPEFWLQGAVGGRSVADWCKVAIELPGKETEQLSKFAQERKVYVAGAAFEFDPHWPHRWFNTAFIIDDSGNMIHKYRKIQCADVIGLLPDTTPGNLYSAYVDRYGYDGLFPVTDTPIGRLGTIVCFDMNFPETARALAKRGAEVILHPTAEPHNERRRAWDLGRRARAFENTAYVLSCSEGGEFPDADSTTPHLFHRGCSKIISYDGTIDLIADGPGALALKGSLDLASLRRARADATVNLALWDEPGVYGSIYRDTPGYPLDLWLDTPMESTAEGMAANKATIARHSENGVFVPPRIAPSLTSAARPDGGLAP